MDEATTDNTVLNADGSKTETVTTIYTGGTQKSQKVITTSANGQNVSTTTTAAGYGNITDTVTVAADGTKTETIAYYNSSNSLLKKDITTTSADGRRIEVDHYNSSNKYTGADITLTTSGAYGSYVRVSMASNQSINQEMVHTIDANGIDHVTYVGGGTLAKNGYVYWTKTLSLAQEAEAQAVVERLYSTLLNRTPTSEEATQDWLNYYGTSGLDRTGFANSLLSSSEFTQKYGSSLTKPEFIQQIYQNALGRNATLAELSNWLGQLAAGTATEASIAIAVSESAEHIADGNVYQVTNNTYNVSGAYTLDHTTDTAVANAAVQNLFETTLGRAASSSELSSYAGYLLNGSKTETQIAAALTSLSEFTTKYGSLSNTDFVSQIFVNGLGRLPTAAEAAYWVNQLATNGISRGDLVTAVAESPDHLKTQNQQVTVVTVSGTGNTIYAASETLDFLAGAGGTVDSGGDTINLAANNTITVNASGDIINAVAGDTVSFATGVTGVVNGTGVTINGASGNTITLSANASDIIGGNGATFVAASTDTLTFVANATDTVIGSGVTIIGASGDTITLAANASDNIGGSGATIIAVSTDTLSFAANASGTVSGSGVAITLANGATVSASSDAITLAAGASATVSGSGNMINAGSGNTVTFVSGATDTVNGSGVTINVTVNQGVGDSLTATGNSDTVNGPGGLVEIQEQARA